LALPKGPVFLVPIAVQHNLCGNKIDAPADADRFITAALNSCGGRRLLRMTRDDLGL